MIPEIESFGHLMIARRAGGEPVGLVRSPDEVVFLAFDASIKRLVELHILRSGRTLDSVAKKSAFDRAKQASEIRGPSFMRILDVGEDQGLVYYTSNLNDGEFIEDYVKRRGPLQPATVFSLVFQLLDDLLQLKQYQRLVSQMRLDRVVMTTLEDTFLQLRIYDYGLSSTESEHGSGARLVVQICELMFLMLTGKTFAGDNPDRYPSLTSLPMSLRTAMRAALTDPANSPTSIERVRDDVREAIGALVSSINARNPRKQLVVIPALQPRSQLQDLLLENVPVEIILGNRFRVEGENDVRRYPFSIPCLNTKNEQPVTVHLLPPSRIVDKTQYEAVPLQMWRFNADKHPNILRSLSLWESPEWTFLTEEREPGFSLSRLLAERITLNPQEVSVLLRQVQAGQEQALECGVQRLDLHPSNIVLRVGKNGPLMSREHDRLMQKRLDAWPAFCVKLRAHLTMRNLYEPPLVDKPEHGEHMEAHLADRDYRCRAFIALAAYLLTGQRQTGGSPRFPEATPEPLADFVQECLEKSRNHGQAPNPAEFLMQFESLMHASTTTGPDLASRLRGVTVPIEEMESMGSVSDFDNEWASGSDEDEEPAMPVTPISRKLKPTDFSSRKPNEGMGWPIWAAAASVTLAAAGWWLFSGEDPIPPPKTASVSKPASKPEVPTEDAPVVANEPSAPTPPPAVAKVEPEPKPAPSQPVDVPAPPTVAAKPSNPAPGPVTMPGEKPQTPPAPATVGVPAPVPEPKAEAEPPAPPPGAQPVPIIRKAILPTPEEIAKYKQGLVKPPVQLPAQATPPVAPSENQRSGSIPAINMAQPAPGDSRDRQ
ncbi:hypothetical protein EI77_00976 [Prosthecobacter fusiformis]|uniref:Protein kinase domain-containing protein n=1 Tax=Prosthecobacter fusiformis TaxID=48464 RepID=A0A4R7ST50_9BACT|nr:hypothetical protein [Prosthecobacter fusiformis]TDU81666.1 hypothetical protein EI77_00976 [Prosthecobacter fusiformis]